METLKALFGKPDPQAQLRRCNAIFRTNARQLDREIEHAKKMELKAKSLILQADKRARDPSRRAQAHREMRELALELSRRRRAAARLVTCKARLNSVQMQVGEAFVLRRVEGSIRAGTGVLRDVNSLARLPALAGTMRELSGELVRAGIIDDMVGEVLPEDKVAELEDEDAEGEIDKVLREILKDRLPAATKVAINPVPQDFVTSEPQRTEGTETTGDRVGEWPDCLKG